LFLATEAQPLDGRLVVVPSLVALASAACSAVICWRASMLSMM
jgi:hypothetical protein